MEQAKDQRSRILLFSGIGFILIALVGLVAYLPWKAKVFPVVTGCLFLPVAAGMKDKSWKQFFVAVVASTIGIYIPLCVFIASGIPDLLPRSKAACPHGWIHCLPIGKLALTPLLLWALAALYTADILRVRKPYSSWIVFGITVGAVVNTVCFLVPIGLIIAYPGPWHRIWSMMEDLRGPIPLLYHGVPLYVSLWFTVRAVQILRTHKLNPAVFLVTLLGTVPFWIAAALWSIQFYDALPEQYNLPLHK